MGLGKPKREFKDTFSAEKVIMDKFFNDSPAAPVEGLETVAIQHEYPVAGQWRFGECPFEPKECVERELVTRSQAEAIIAAKDATLQDAIDCVKVLTDEKNKFEADNAALTARVKELEEAKSVIAADKKTLLDIASANGDRVQALETQLAAAKKAARSAHDTLIEINPSNYDHDDVCQLNDASVEAIFLLADVIGETHGKSKEWWDERRAALEAKP